MMSLSAAGAATADAIEDASDDSATEAEDYAENDDKDSGCGETDDQA